MVVPTDVLNEVAVMVVVVLVVIAGAYALQRLIALTSEV